MTDKERFIEIVKSARKHRDYKHVCDLADLYRKFITGKNIDSLLERFNPREDEVMFEQRKRLTTAITPAVCSSIKKPFSKVPRTMPVTRKIAAKKESDADIVTEVEERIQYFYGGDGDIGGLDYFLQNKFTNLSFLDPNAWVVIEFDVFNNEVEKAWPRPFIASAKDAIDYNFKGNDLDYLVACTPFTYRVDGKEQTGNKYTYYGEDYAYTLEPTALRFVEGAEVLNIEGIGQFVFREHKYKWGKVPAFRVGYIYDIETDERTYVSPLHDALCYLHGSIKEVSEYNLSTCLHTFPQKIVRLTKVCEGEDSKGCDKGRTRDGAICSKCRGTGRPIHTSGQDIVEVQMPDSDVERVIPLSDFVYYVPLPIELLRFQKEVVDECKINCHQAIFNSTSLLKKSGHGVENIESTATEVDNDMESVYDTLAPFAEKVSSVWVTIVDFITRITDNYDKLIIIHRFPSKFKLKSRFDLYRERKMLADSNAPSFVITSVDDELAEDIYADDADGLLRYRVKAQHFPFPGKTAADIANVLASTQVLNSTKILYNYFDTIFRDIEAESRQSGKDFYLLKFAERQSIIDEKVKKIAESLKSENTIAIQF